jgi:hypothetical protein
MPKFIKTLLLSLFLLDIAGIASAQTTLATGLLSVCFDSKTVLSFYNSPSAKASAKTS